MEDSYRRIWEEIGAGIRPHVSPDAFQRWFASIELVHADELALTFEVPNTIYQLQFFSNPAADPSGFGQGETFMLTKSVTTNGSGVASFIEVLDSERTLRQNELSRAQSATVVGEDLVSLYRALGGGWEPAIDAKARP